MEWHVDTDAQYGRQANEPAGVAPIVYSDDDGESAAAEFNFDLRRFIVGIWQRRWTGLGVAAVTFALALVVISTVSGQWQAATTLIKRSHQDLFSLVERDPFKTQDYSLATLLDTLKLPSSMMKVASDAGINVAPTSLAAALRVSLNRDSTILNLGLTWNDPEVAADLLNRIADQFIERTRTLVSNDASKGYEYYSAQLENAREKARTASVDVMAFRREHGISDLDAETKILLEELSRLRGEYNSRVAEVEAMKAASLRLAEEISLEPEQMIMYTIYRSPLKTRLADYEWDLQEAKGKYTEENPKVIKLKEKIGSLNSMIEATNDQEVPENTYTQNNKRFQMELRQQELGDEIKVREAQAVALRGTLEEMQAKVNLLSSREKDYLLLKSRLDGFIALQQQLARRVEETRLVMERNDASFDIVERAVPPVEPLPSGRKILAVASLVFAAGLGFVLVLFLEWRDPFIRSLRDVTDIFGHEIAIEVESTPGGARQLVEARNPISPLANQYRRLCNDMDAAQDRRQLSLGVISTCAGEGRTSVAANLAQMRAIKGQRVYLVDADLRPDAGRRPAGLVGITEPASGLNEHLVEGLPLRVQETADTGLGYLPAAAAGIADVQGLMKLGTCDLDATLETLAGPGHNVIDLPPVNDFEVTLEVASQLDGVVLVAHSGRTQRSSLKALAAQLEKRGIPCIAAVVLEVPVERMAGTSPIKWPGVPAWAEQWLNKGVSHA